MVGLIFISATLSFNLVSRYVFVLLLTASPEARCFNAPSCNLSSRNVQSYSILE
jgi:hypothetical protein